MKVTGLPAEYGLGKLGEAAEHGDGFAVFIFKEVLEELAVLRSLICVDADVGLEHGRDGDHEARRLDVSEPFLMARTAGSLAMAYLVTGQR